VKKSLICSSKGEEPGKNEFVPFIRRVLTTYSTYIMRIDHVNIIIIIYVIPAFIFGVGGVD